MTLRIKKRKFQAGIREPVIKFILKIDLIVKNREITSSANVAYLSA